MRWYNFIFLLILVSIVTANVYVDPRSRVHLITKLKKILSDNKDYIHGPELKDDDIYCKCNEKNCDHEIVEIAGIEFRGICRVPKGGQCHTVKSLNNLGMLAEIHLQCLNAEDLLPPMRPFQCHSIDESYINYSCCDYEPLCNDVDV